MTIKVVPSTVTREIQMVQNQIPSPQIITKVIQSQNRELPTPQ